MQGFNMGRYHPPSSLDNALSPTDSPRPSKSRKLSPAAPPTVRFEMPFAIWCSTCPSNSNSQLIGQGVRFNAQKRKVGNYYTTPVWSFRMKHTACSGWIEIRTDPKNSEYLITEGARKRDTGDDLAVAGREGALVIGLNSDERDRERQDAFAALEGKKEDNVRAKGEARRIEELKSLIARDWKYADEANRKIRAAFRIGRKSREKDAEVVEQLQDKMSLGIDLVSESEADKRRAELVEFGDLGDQDALEATQTPLFAVTNAKQSRRKNATAANVETLQSQLSNNTRAIVDPFAMNAMASSRAVENRMPPRARRKVVSRSRESKEQDKATRDDRNALQIGESRVQSPGDVSEQATNGLAPRHLLVEYESD